jgi:hypothetical protein
MTNVGNMNFDTYLKEQSMNEQWASWDWRQRATYFLDKVQKHLQDVATYFEQSDSNRRTKVAHSDEGHGIAIYVFRDDLGSLPEFSYYIEVDSNETVTEEIYARASLETGLRHKSSAAFYTDGSSRMYNVRLEDIPNRVRESYMNREHLPLREM